MKRAILIAAIITFVTGSHLWAEGVDLQKFTHEIQKLERGENSIRLVWWIPTEFWEECFRNVPRLTQDQKNEFYKAVDNYIVLGVLDAKTTAFGSLIPTAKDEIVSKLTLAIDQGKQIKPLSDSEVSSDARNLFAMMKPVMANMLGQLGQGLEFICFKGVDSEGKRILDPIGRASFSVELAGSTFKWRLPLGSLLQPKYDPDTGEEFPGNYIYNPFTGKTLITKSSNK